MHAKKKPEDSAPPTLIGHSAEHLDLIEAEIFRQRSVMSQKVGNAYTRASILIGSAGLLGGVGVGVSSANAQTVALVMGTLLSAISVVCGIVALRPMKGEEIDLEALVDQTRSDSDEALRRTILWNNLVAYRDYELSLGNRTRWLVWGFIALSSMFVLTGAISAYDLAHPAPVVPTQVRIVH